ncbi:putative CocE/NonD hydrolase [Crocosphaera subtropica ATCC 51142]|uniref:CocE/NonD hydrolase n=1 Tax=Crocosphaera subtropica (strain ATCC 51142 / BH68) TaxID=43989 RepID=B1WSZ7_CROS5|nr:CocE/NonD family hydrolase [Crocosphaera subtropica]ACB50327.1 putative CocE/NonD hydrolase [Crocosphaera subtropica ATCC 51142]
MYQVKKETLSLTTRDGIRLDADVYRPHSTESFPILLMRQPYGKQIASTVVYAHPIWYASQGYIVVIQDVRGRGTSQGDFDLFAHEIEDGFDTINWVSQLPGSTGTIGMYGFSYQGMTQLYVASMQSKALKTICPAMVAYDLYEDWGYENGAFCLQTNLGWAIQLAAETAKLKGDSNAFHKLYEASRNLPLSDPIPAYPNLMKEVASNSFYHDWINYCYPDNYWCNLSPKRFIDKLDLPMLHIGGWFDPYLRGNINLYNAMKIRSNYPQNLVIGPWGHIPWGSKLGSHDYTKLACSFIDQYQIDWFDHFLKGKDIDYLYSQPISLFEMGSNQWNYSKSWENKDEKNYYIFSQGLANVKENDGQLIDTISDNNVNDIIVHDPWRPVPSVGGHASIPSGSFERSQLDTRFDILTYTSEQLTEDLLISGTPFIEIYCTADAPSFDICAILSEIKPDGKVYNFSQGYCRINSEKLPIKISLQPTCIKINEGNYLRLSISGACFPAYALNTGTGKFPYEERLIDAKIITIKVWSQPDQPSTLILPIP